MKLSEALKDMNIRFRQLARHGKAKAEIHISPRGEEFISISLIAGESKEYLVDKHSILED